MADQQYWSAGRTYGCRVTRRVLATIAQWAVDACPSETGGILIGHYSTDRRCARVTQALPAPVDSGSGPTWFHRGTDGLQQQLQHAWNVDDVYYLGEWHVHPNGTPAPSAVDIQQMRAIARSPAYHCPEPLLLVLAGTPSHSWQIGLFVVPSGRAHIALHGCQPTP